ncbi:MAG: hypothetical protein QGI88_08065, partial [SAR202 cluster bacterium]|nr:hypothetical protein [SAR202 cluster bacterium]
MVRLRLLVIGVTLLTLALIACGGSSDSTGDSTGEGSGSSGSIFPDEYVEEKIRLNLKQPDGRILVESLGQLTEFSLALDLFVEDLTG